MKRYAILVAAGRGERAGMRLAKQFQTMGDKPLWQYALEALAPYQPDQGVVVFPKEVLNALHFTIEPYQAIPGGDTRFESVCAGLKALEGMGLTDNDWVLVHDAARPCLHAEDLARLLLACDAAEPVGALLVKRLSDTLKQITHHVVQETVDRNAFCAAQTPQLFRAKWLKQGQIACEKASLIPTDESQMLELLGLQPKVVFAHYANIKVTYPEDWKTVESLLKELGRF